MFRHRRWMELISGFVCMGFGQEFIRRGVITPWAEDRSPSLGMGLLASSLIFIGGFLLFRLFLWFYGQSQDKQKIVKSLGFGVGASLLSGLVLGLLGQFIYSISSFNYYDMKMGIWFVTTLVQMAIKVTLLYYWICLYQSIDFQWSSTSLRWSWILASMSGVIGMGVSIVFPVLEGFFLYWVDSIVVIGMIYYFIIQEKE